MLKTKDIRDLLLDELKNNNIKDTGYDCFNGRYYVEVRNALFEVDNDKIFNTIPPLERMIPEWYEKNYDPILERNNQFIKCIKKLIDNPNSRQAVIIMGDVNEYDYPAFICTMYMHMFLIKQENDHYILEYVVHMRSNDVIEFDTDLIWHKKIIKKILNVLEKFYIIDDVKIYWNADTIHLYSEFFEQALNEKN